MEEKKKINLILILAFISASLPLLIPGVEGHIGQDLGFHLNRIEGLYTEIKNGVFPVKMQSLWMDGYGYPVSIYYCDIFLYIPALLRLIGVPVVAAYKAYIWLVNLITVIISYRCFYRISGSRYLGAIGAFVYTTSNYRLLDLYIRAAVGEYTALIFLPLVACGICLIYGWTADEKEADGTEAILTLTAGMTGILLSHILTLEIVGICLILVCVFNLKKTFEKKAFLTYLISAVSTLLISMFFTVPFLDYFTTETVRVNQVVGNARQIQESGTRLYEYFDFFMIPFSNLDPSISDDRMLTSPGIILMGTLIAGMGVCLARKADKRIAVLTLTAIVILFVASDMFPWNALANSGPVGDLLAQVQFPWRYTGIGNVVLTLLLLSLLGKARPDTGKAVALIISVGIIMCIWFVGVYGRYAELEHFKTTSDLDTFDMGCIEYLREDTDRDEFKKKVDVIRGSADTEVLDRKGTSMDIFIKSEEGATIELPVLNYKYYKVSDEKTDAYEIFDGENDEICFTVPQNYEGVISLRYEEPMFWHLAEIISLISFVIFSVVMAQRCRKIVYEG